MTNISRAPGSPNSAPAVSPASPAASTVAGQSIESDEALRDMLGDTAEVTDVEALAPLDAAAAMETPRPGSSGVVAATASPADGSSDVTLGLKKGDEGASVAALQQHLRASGARLFLNGKFDGPTEYALKLWQKEHTLEPTGVVDEATAKAMAPGAGLNEARSLVGDRAKTVGDASVEQAAKGVEAHKLQNRFECARYVHRAFDEAGIEVDSVPSAYQYAEVMAKHPGFKEVQVSREDLEQLPKGAVVVWGKNDANKNGHIGIVTGKRDGQSHLIQASDREQPLSAFANASEAKRYGNDWGSGATDGPEFRVFIPVDDAAGEAVNQ